MARLTGISQEQVNNTADELQAKGINPSPNTLREIIGIGSYTTLKKMLDIWKDNEAKDSGLFIPKTPEFAYHLIEKLYKILYLRTKQQLEKDNQQQNNLHQETEHSKVEQLTEIRLLETNGEILRQALAKKEHALKDAEICIKQAQNKVTALTETLNNQKIEIARLVEREKQHRLQLEEKDQMLYQHIKTLLKKSTEGNKEN